MSLHTHAGAQCLGQMHGDNYAFVFVFAQLKHRKCFSLNLICSAVPVIYEANFFKYRPN